MLIIWEESDFSESRVFATKVKRPKDPKDLNKSHYVCSKVEGRVTHKTCTRCSQDAGEFVWLEVEMFSHRSMEDGSFRPQPQCGPCRGKRNGN